MNDGSSREGKFEDPLENYDPKTYDDPLQQAIAEESVLSIQHEPHASIHPDTTVAEAVEKLAADHVSCLLVEEDGKLVGVFTDREVLNKVALEIDRNDRPVRELMTENPVFVYSHDPVASALCVMAASGFRHVPIVDTAERVVGIVSPQRVTNFLSTHMS